MRRFFCLCILLCITILLTTVIPLSVVAASSGTVGNCQWSLDGKVLTISGDGKLAVSYGNAPWGKSITEVKIEEGITSIGDGVFTDCPSLYKVTMPSTLKVIGYNAFSNCTALTVLDIPDGVTTICNYAFSDCSSLVNISIPKTVTDIGVGVFSECYSLANIFVDADNDSYTSVDGVLFSKDRSVLVRYPADKIGNSYTVADCVKEIGHGAFEAAWNLLEIKLPDGLTKIGTNAFFKTVPFNDKDNFINGCFYLGNHLIVVKDETMTTCTVRNGTKTIADGAFVMPNKIEKIILPEGLEYIGDSAFGWCETLKSVAIPKSLVKIDNSAFMECGSITNVYYTGSSTDREKITIGTQNADLTNVLWKYNACHNGKEHTWKKVTTTKASTCTEAGEKRMTCSVCSVTLSEKLEPTGHKYGQWSQTKAPTCVETGKEERVCPVCGTVETKEIGTLGHVFGPWSVEVEASCEDVGVQKRVCAVCQHVQAQNIEPKGHNFGDWITDKTGLKTSICEVCGAVRSEVLDKTERAEKGYIVYLSVAGAVIVLAGVVVGFVMIKKKKTVPKEADDI